MFGFSLKCAFFLSFKKFPSLKWLEQSSVWCLVGSLWRLFWQTLLFAYTSHSQPPSFSCCLHDGSWKSKRRLLGLPWEMATWPCDLAWADDKKRKSTWGFWENLFSLRKRQVECSLMSPFPLFSHLECRSRVSRAGVAILRPKCCKHVGKNPTR